MRPSPEVPTAPAVPKFAAILLHPTNHRIAASTGCGRTGARAARNPGRRWPLGNMLPRRQRTGGSPGSARKKGTRPWHWRFDDGPGAGEADRRCLHIPKRDTEDSRHSAILRACQPSPTRAQPQSGRRCSPPGPVRRPRGLRRRCPPAHWFQYAVGRPTQDSWKRSPTCEARAHGRAHGHMQGARPGARRRHPVRRPSVPTHNNLAIRKTAS